MGMYSNSGSCYDLQTVMPSHSHSAFGEKKNTGLIHGILRNSARQTEKMEFEKSCAARTNNQEGKTEA